MKPADLLGSLRSTLADRRYRMVALAVMLAYSGLWVVLIFVTAAFRRYLDAHGLRGKVFVSAKPNSMVMSTQTYEGPEVAAARLPELLEAGADMIGYCCGSWPEHIRVTADGLRALRPGP